MRATSVSAQIASEPPRPPRKAQLPPPRQLSRNFVVQNAIASAGTLGAGLLGFGFQAVLSHRLHPAEYGAAFAVITLTQIVTLPAGGFKGLIAWRTSREMARFDTNDGSMALLRSATFRLLMAGVVIAVLASVLAEPLASFLQVPPLYVYCAAAGIPFQMVSPLLLGTLQGAQRFRAWSYFSAAIAGGRLLAALILVVPFGTVGVLVGLSVASAGTYFVGLFLVRRRFQWSRAAANWTGSLRYLGLMVTSLLALNVLLSLDVVVVKHYFSPHAAGQYAAVAAISRSVFWGMSGIVSVLFPKVAARHAKGQGTSELVLASLGLTVLGGLACMAVVAIGGKFALAIFAGHAYKAGSYFTWYVLGMAMLGSASVFINALQSLARYSLLWIMVPASIGRVVAISLVHPSLLTVVRIGDLVIAIALVLLGAAYVLQERSRASSRSLFSRSQVAVAMGVQQ